MKKGTNGFTLVEVLIATLVGLVVMLAATTGMMDFFKNGRTSQNMNDLTLASEAIMTKLTQDIHWADEVEYVESSEVNHRLRLTTNSVPPQVVTYQWLDDTLFEDGNRVHGSDIVVKRFEAKNVADSEAIGLWRITLNLEHTDRFAAKKVLETQTSISGRSHQLGGP